MKDAKGHGSNPRGAHQARVESIPDRRAVELEKIGRENASSALDQAGDYKGIEDALDSFYVNLGDTLTEMGVTDQSHIRAAMRGFESVLKERKITFRPHGLG